MRANYSDDLDDQWQLIRWRGAVKSAIKGARGQAFLKEMLIAMHALPKKELIAEQLIDGRGDNEKVCAIGTVGKLRQIDMRVLDPEDYDSIAEVFGIAPALVREIEYVNDEYLSESAPPEKRFETVRKWVVEQLAGPEPQS